MNKDDHDNQMVINGFVKMWFYKSWLGIIGSFRSKGFIESR